jgi:hypothetical protein
MKKFTLALTLSALPLAWLGSGFVLRWFASDETKIRWIVASMEEDYNAGDPSDCIEAIAANWRHEGTEMDRRMLFGALLGIARERDRETRQLRTKVEVDEEAAAITVDGERATLTLEAQFLRRKGEDWAPSWRTRIEADLRDGDDGWEIVASRHEDLAGTHLGR